MISPQTNLIGGVNLDKDPRALQTNELSYAKDMEVTSITGGTDTSAQPFNSSELSYSIPSIQTQNKYYRLKYDSSVVSYTLSIVDASGNSIGPSSFTVSVGANVAAFVTNINAVLSLYGFTASYDDQQGLWISFTIVQGSTPVDFTMTEIENDGVSSTPIILYVLQEAVNIPSALNRVFRPLQAMSINGIQFVFSSVPNAAYGQIGYAVKDLNGDWTYTELVTSSSLKFYEDKPIEIQAELITNGQYALYWINSNGKPKVIYIPSSLAQFAPLKYTMASFENASSGLFNLGALGLQTDLQIQNPARPEFASQADNGGNLEAGTYWYFIQAGINNDFSEWSVPTSPVTVFSEGIDSPSSGFSISGDLTPVITGKTNTITIKNIDPTVYNRYKIGYVICQGGAYSGKIIGEFDVPSAEFEYTHDGYETGSSDYDIGLFPPVQQVFLNANNVQTKKNRLNLPNVEVAIDDSELEDIFSSVTLGQTTETLDNTGYVTLTENPLFRVSIASQFNVTGANEQLVSLTVNSSNGDFNSSGAYNTGTNIFVPPANGDYYLQIGLTYKFPNSGSAKIRSIYAIDIVTGQKLVEIIPLGLSFQLANIYTTKLVSLTTAMQISFKYFVDDGNNDLVIFSGYMAATQAISSYNNKFLTSGEYQIPSNIANKLGYTVNETYPFFARCKYDNGYTSNWYFMGNYTFNGGSSPALSTNAVLTDSTVDTNTLTYGLTINGLDVSTLKADGVTSIEIGRGLAPNSVLGTGIFIPSHGFQGGNEGGSFKAGLYTGNTSGGSYGQNVNNTSNFRYFGVMICPDWLLNGPPQFLSGDQIINYGQVETTLASFIQPGANGKWGSGVDTRGYFVIGAATTPQTIDVIDAAGTEFNTNSRILKNDAQGLYLQSSSDNTGLVDTLATKCMALTLGSRIIPQAGTPSGSDLGMYYVQYVRQVDTNWNPTDLTVVSCGHFIDISKSTPDILPEQVVFGGDTYTQKTYTKIMYNAYNPDTATGGTLTSFIGYLSQNRENLQMMYVDKTFTNRPFPFSTPLGDYLFGTYDAQEQFQIDRGYTWYLPLANGIAYNSKLIQERYLQSRIYYSQQKPLGGIVDTYRTILPNDYKDLPAKYGAIVGLYDTNDVMVSIQARMVHVLPYQSDVMLSSQDGSIYVGNGGVYAQREIPVSTFGSTFKTATLLAENGVGNAQVYWFSNTAKAFLRYGPDGVRNLSEENGWRTFFLNNSLLCVDNFDVVLGFDRQRKSVFVTARAINSDIPVWSSGATYAEGDAVMSAFQIRVIADGGTLESFSCGAVIVQSLSSIDLYQVGDVVRYGATNQYKNFEQTQDFYVSLTNGNTGNNPYTKTSNWQYIPETDVSYYNKWTAVWNERRNFFTGFFSALPERYFFYEGSLMAPRGIPAFNSIYDLFGGTTYLQWFSNGTTYKQGSFEVEYAINLNGRGLAPARIAGIGMQVGMNHDEANNPSVEVYTELQNADNVSNGPSLMAATDFEFLNGQIGVGVFPNAQDEVIIGDWAKVKYVTDKFLRVFSMVSRLYVKRRILSK